jgi:hypothetical protein
MTGGAYFHLWTGRSRIPLEVIPYDMISRLYFLLGAMLILSGCEVTAEEPGLPVPKVFGPTGNVIFYPTDKGSTIRWEVPDSTETVEMQLITSLDSLLYKRGTQPFEGQPPSLSISNTSRTLVSSSAITNDNARLYVGYRLRYVIIRNHYQPNETRKESAWSDIHYYRLYPFKSLPILSLNLTGYFEFTTQQQGNYLSGPVRSANKFNLDSFIVAKGFDLKRLKMVRPTGGTVKSLDGGLSNYHEIAVGFRDTGLPHSPVDAWVDAWTVRQTPNLTVPYYYSPPNRNLYDDLGKRTPYMYIAYRIGSNGVPEPWGERQRLSVNMSVDCYFEE